MNTNVGTIDALIRGALAAGFGGLAIVLAANLIVSLTAAVFALVLGATALTRFCPVYSSLGIDTRRHPS